MNPTYPLRHLDREMTLRQRLEELGEPSRRLS